jgi:tRNA(fMet)-specific endonuclease VapC
MSAPVLVDTDVFSFLFKGDTRGSLYLPHLSGNTLNLAFATVAELYRWTVMHGWGKARIDDLNMAIGRCAVVSWDDATAWHWARVMSIKGRPITEGDAWVAAVALRHGLPLVTHNRKHFDGIAGLTVISEG